MNTDFILSLFQHGYKARISTLYHLLKGKRSSSVLLYGFLYNNLRFIECFPTLKEKDFQAIINQLFENGLLNRINEGYGQLTKKGQLELNRLNSSVTNYPWIDHYRFGKKDDEILRILLFSVQVVSNLSYDNKQYLPVEASSLYQWALKKWLTRLPKKELIKQFQTEWVLVFDCVLEEEALYFVEQFSGYQQVGKTSNQVINSALTSFEKNLLHRNYLHHLLSIIKTNRNLPLLSSLINWPFFQKENQSMQETKRFLKSNSNVETIAKHRNLKVSTIKDHLLELALLEDFPFDSFIDEKIAEQLAEVKTYPYQDWSYQLVRRQIPTLSYFEFRLYQVQNIRKERLN